MMIDPPEKNIKRDVTRALIEAAAQTNPLSGALARLYQTTHPSKSEQDRTRWEQEVTDRVNSLPSAEELRQFSERLTEVPTRAELRENPTTLAIGTLMPGGSPDIEGIISSVIDHGTGDQSINFDTALDSRYHVSLSVLDGHANLVDQAASGFRIRTLDDDRPIDTKVSFAVIGRYAS